ncbi:NACHT domain-containing protein [Xylariomycetidae sp. FL2044]|nr:NACHT domain-containing protein [Xylariomycetidae sp. FL2044]
MGVPILLFIDFQTCILIHFGCSMRRRPTFSSHPSILLLAMSEMESTHDGIDPSFEFLLAEFENVHRMGLARLKNHVSVAVDIVQKYLTVLTNVKHTKAEPLLKDVKKAVETLRRRQGERIEVGRFRSMIESGGENWTDYCKQRNLQDEEGDAQGFQNVTEMFVAMHDLARFRISLTYYERDTPKVVDFFGHHFDIVHGPTEKGGRQKEIQRLHTQIEQGGSASNNKPAVFPGYKATHVIIKHKPDQPLLCDDEASDPWDIVIEVQIGSVGMYDWADIEHDLIYKLPHGRQAPEDVKRFLDMMNGNTLVNDMMKDYFITSVLQPTEEDDTLKESQVSHQMVLHSRTPPLTEKDREILAELGGTDPKMDKCRIEETKGSLLKDSYKWILTTKEFLGWRDFDDEGMSRLLWVRGDPGKGKTMLVCGIITELDNRTQSDVDLCYFFCQATDTHLNSATSVLRGLLSMLVHQQPSLMSHLRDYSVRMVRQILDGKNALYTVKSIFNSMLRDTRFKKTRFIIDALDECQHQQSELISWIEKWSQDCPRAKWMVSSRNWPPTAQAIGVIKDKATVSLELNAHLVSEAVVTYIRFTVNWLANRKGFTDFTRAAIEQYLILKADNTFLWVALMCQSINKTRLSPDEILERLPSLFPPGLDQIYSRMIDMIAEDDADGVADQCLNILATMTISYEPMTLRELSLLVRPDPHIWCLTDIIRTRVEYCGFLVQRDDTVYFVHQSAQEYLVKNARQRRLDQGPEADHRRLFIQSVNILDYCINQMLGEVEADVIGAPPKPEAPVRYLAVHWIDHFLSSIAPDKNEDAAALLDQGGELRLWLERNFLFWIELLSAESRLKSGIGAMEKLAGFAEDHAEPETQEVLYNWFTYMVTELAARSRQTEDGLQDDYYSSGRYLEEEDGDFSSSPFRSCMESEDEGVEYEDEGVESEYEGMECEYEEGESESEGGEPESEVVQVVNRFYNSSC